MKAVVLAAGRGSRLRQLTETRPKALVEIAGRPILEWTLDAVRAAGIRDVLVVRGYRGETLTGPFDTVDNPDWERSNMVVSLLAADGWLRQDACIVSYADIVFAAEHVRTLAAVDSDIAITYDRLWRELWLERFADPLADAETFRTEDGRLVEIGRRAETVEDIAGQYMGLLKITPEGWRTIRALVDNLPADAVNRLDMTGLLARLIEVGTRIATVPVDGRWCEVDSGADLALYTRRLAEVASTGRWTHDWR